VPGRDIAVGDAPEGVVVDAVTQVVQLVEPPT
jgi:hypothetical protein